MHLTKLEAWVRLARKVSVCSIRFCAMQINLETHHPDFLHTLACSRPYLPTLLWGYSKHQDRPEDVLLEIKSIWDLKLNQSWFFLKGMKWGWGPLGKPCELKLKAVLEWSWSPFLTVIKIVRKESKIGEGSEHSFLPYSWNHEPSEQKDRRSDGERELMQWGRACLRTHCLHTSPTLTTEEKHVKKY